jgi:hypothetical protein
VLHWHGETFDLPTGAELLAGNDNCPTQAFRVGEAAWGIQFHLEVTTEAVDGFLAAFAAEAADEPGGVEGVRTAAVAALAALAPARDFVCQRFAGLVASRAPE